MLSTTTTLIYDSYCIHFVSLMLSSLVARMTTWQWNQDVLLFYAICYAKFHDYKYNSLDIAATAATDMWLWWHYATRHCNRWNIILKKSVIWAMPAFITSSTFKYTLSCHWNPGLNLRVSIRCLYALLHCCLGCSLCVLCTETAGIVLQSWELNARIYRRLLDNTLASLKNRIPTQYFNAEIVYSSGVANEVLMWACI